MLTLDATARFALSFGKLRIEIPENAHVKKLRALALAKALTRWRITL